jgi:hypothetical protein
MSEGTSTSSNPQTAGWQQHYTKNKPIRKTKETAYAGISVKWFYVTGFWAIVSLCMAVPLYLVSDVVLQSFLIALNIAWWGIYLAYFRTCDLYDKSILVLKFMFDEYSGLHQIYKFDMDVKTLQSHFPIVGVLEDGLIRFTQDRYGVLINYIPLQVTEEDTERHLMSIQSIINRMSGDMMVKFIGSSRFGTPSPLLKKIEKKMNNPKTSKKDYNLLLSIHDKVKTGDLTPDWDFNIFLGFGKCDTVDDAKEMLLTELPGFMDGLENAGILAEQIIDRDEIVKSYKQFLIPRDLI